MDSAQIGGHASRNERQSPAAGHCPPQDRYRADIDGLRAVAVLAVITYHAFPRALPGGFTGVDVFFVISGYLISGILAREHAAGTFRFRNFYARRIKRLFPSLIAMLALVLAYGWLALLPDEYQRMGRHVAAGTLFAQNIAFLQESGYFDTDAMLKPLLHLWSLAVEEQMYLALPPLLVVAWRMRWPWVPLVALLTVCSFAANMFASERFPAADFFLSPYRAWQFLCGTLLAWRHERSHEADERIRLRHGLAGVGGLLLASGFALFDHGDPYPGWRALVPTIGTVALIAAGPATWLNRRILAHPVLVWVGLISYPLYLFHWPLLSFVHIVRGEAADTAAIFVALVFAFALASATYALLERRIRHSRSPWAVPSLVVAFLALGMVGYGVWRGALPPRAGIVDARLRVDAALAERQNTGYFDGWQKPRFIDGIPRHAIGGDGPQTLVVGDSHAHMLAPRIHELLHDHGKGSRGAIMITKAGACPLPGLTSPTRQLVENLVPAMMQEARSEPTIDRVVIVAFWPYYFSECWKSKKDRYLIDGVPLNTPDGQEKALEALGGMLSQLTDAGKRVTVLLTVPFGEELDPRSGYRRNFFGGLEPTTRGLGVEDFRARHGDLNARLAAIARANGAEVIDPLAWLQSDGTCITDAEDGPIRFDQSHLRSGFTRRHATYIDDVLKP